MMLEYHRQHDHPQLRTHTRPDRRDLRERTPQAAIHRHPARRLLTAWFARPKPADRRMEGAPSGTEQARRAYANGWRCTSVPPCPDWGVAYAGERYEAIPEVRGGASAPTARLMHRRSARQALAGRPPRLW
jgi:hypothetical protein